MKTTHKKNYEPGDAVSRQQAIELMASGKYGLSIDHPKMETILCPLPTKELAQGEYVTGYNSQGMEVLLDDTSVMYKVRQRDIGALVERFNINEPRLSRCASDLSGLEFARLRKNTFRESTLP